MEEYFNIKYEFGKYNIWKKIDDLIVSRVPGYICVADGVVVSNVQRKKDYRETVRNAFFAISDSGWVPKYLYWIYGIEREQYCGPQIFQDLVKRGKYRMFFMGTNQNTLDSLKKQLTEWNPAVKDMTFYELPYNHVREFDYESIGKMVNDDGADLIWVALGAPKQDFFMQLLRPHLNKGLMIGVGAAFNFYSEKGEQRAPVWMTQHRIEFIFRIFQNPKKQIIRCFWIVLLMPKMFFNELRCKHLRSK